MSFGSLFTLRTRGRQARPETAGDLWPPSAGWNERRRPRAPDAAEPAQDAPRRRAADEPPRERGPR